MSDIEKRNQSLPGKIEDLSKFILIKTAELTARRLALKAIKNLPESNEAYQTITKETQDLANDLLYASAKLGEMSKDLPKDIGGDRRSKKYQTDNDVDSKKARLKEIGLTEKQAERFETIAENQDIIEDVINESIKNNDIPTKSEVLKRANKKKKEKKKKEDSKKKIIADGIDSSIIGDTSREVKIGDVIQLGNHTLYCGDAYGMDIKADAIITDPPYGINYEPNWKKWDGSDSDFSKIAGDEEPFNPMPFMKFKTMLFFGANNYSNNLPIGGWLVWDKRLDEVKDAMIGSPFELAWFISRHTAKKAIIKRILHGGVVNADSVSGNNEKRYHPTQKPISLFQSIIEELTHENEIIYDPFAGSGTTLLACELSNRKCRTVEIDPKYCSIIISRWEEMTNKKAIWMQE